MPLPTTPPLSLQQIYTEFAAPLGTALTALVRGGAYVPDTTTNAGVPTTPPIAVLDFLGASAAPPPPAEHTVSPDGYLVSVANGTHNFSLNANVTGGVGPFTYSWSWQSGGINMVISNATSQACSVASTGTNQENSGVIQCVVIDTGNGNLIKSGTSNISVTHGIPA